MDRPTLIEFPSDFPLKIMGDAAPDFAQQVLAVVLRHAPDFDPASMEMRPSSGAKYLSLTCTVRATSQSQLDALYIDLSAHHMVRVVL
ncbi:MAG: DUF493 domain-containing protein [Rhodocyclaceae bacterium]|nr:DUF493 domain-containing protein [Rhodocyclaceae bacterium]